jgi:membrane protein implicated in regulation of membrane protease activity
MKMLATAGLLALVGAVVAVHAVVADAPNRPPGVSATAWAPVSDTLGIVLVQQGVGAADPGPIAPADGKGNSALGGLGGAILSPPQNGYFMVKRGGRWARLVVVEPLKGPGDAG